MASKNLEAVQAYRVYFITDCDGSSNLMGSRELAEQVLALLKKANNNGGRVDLDDGSCWEITTDFDPITSGVDSTLIADDFGVDTDLFEALSNWGNHFWKEAAV